MVQDTLADTQQDLQPQTLTMALEAKPWKPATEDNNRLSRPLGVTEVPMVQAISAPRPTPREPVRIHSFVEFTSKHTQARVVTALEISWLHNRLSISPEIATEYHEMQTTYIVAQSSAELDSWKQRTLKVHDGKQTVHEVVREEQQRFEPLPSLHLIPTTTASEDEDEDEGHPIKFRGTLLFLISHWRTEASGAYMILNSLLHTMDDILNHDDPNTSPASISLRNRSQGDEAALLIPAPEDMAQPEPTPPAAAARVKARYEAHKPRRPCIEVPMRTISATTTSGPTHALREVLTTESTTALADACRSVGVTVTSAIHAAYILTIWSLHPAKNRNRWYASMMPVQIRTQMPDPRIRANGCWNAAQMILLSSPPPLSLQQEQQHKTLDFVGRARDLRAQYGVASAPSWLGQEFREESEQMKGLFTGAPEGPAAEPWFTSLGALEKGLLTSDGRYPGGNVRVESNVSAWGDPVGPGVVLTVWSWRGRCVLQGTWNGAFHDREVVERILGGARKEVLAGLGVDLEVERVQFDEY
jgi:hypothetical protein